MEFGLLIGPMALLFVAGAEMAQAVIISRNVDSAAATVAELTSEQVICTLQTNTTPNCLSSSANAAAGNSISTNQLDLILGASTAVMGNAPLTKSDGTSALQVTISAVDIINNSAGTCCSFKIRWSYQQGGGTLRGGSGASCSPSLLTQVDATSTPPAPTNVAKALLPPAAAANKSLPTSGPEGLLIADIGYTYQPPLGQAVVSFLPTMGSTRYMLARLPGQIILAGSVGSVTGQNGNSGHICY